MKTYLARLTPSATGAIATLALHGPAAWEVLEELFSPVGSLASRATFFADIRAQGQPGQFWLGHLGHAVGGAADEVVLALKSVAPVPSFEIHCHGGAQVLALLEEVFCACGVARCSWQELLTHQSGNPLRTAALAALSEAATMRTAALLLDQSHGVFAQAIADVVALLRQEQGDQATQQLQELVRWVPLSQHLTIPWKVAVAGAPNVGKSSLINRLAGYQRCVVSPTPGTTRDVVTTRVAIDGWPVELIDTAGLRATAESLEQQGIDLALAAAAEADLCLWLLDAAAAPVWPPQALPNLHLVVNKIDLPPAWDLTGVTDAVRVSAATGAGFEDLCEALSRWLVPEPPPAGTAVPVTAPWGQRVMAAGRLCAQGNWTGALSILERIED